MKYRITTILILMIAATFILTDYANAEDINTYETDALETHMTYSDTMKQDKKRIISSETIIDKDEDNIKKLIKERIIPDKTDVFESNMSLEINESVKTSSRRLTPSSPRSPSPVKSPR